ncbi:MAG: hypothetical protein OEX04_15335 [Acidimicrobiia bacterium]|nr:hypothetical protein [Acidimicrobiia bacterium]MDH5294430.1 hypothetical protein [Acidimicrobiia bacterium]
MFEERPFLGTIDQRLRNDRVSVVVTLGWAEDMYEGVVEGPADPVQRARLVGEATLRAVETMSGGRARFDLSAVGTSDLGPVKIALVQVREVGWSDYLIGSSLIREGDPASATAKAVLDAVNRRISRVL